MIWRRRGGELLVMAISSLVAIAIAAALWPRLRGLRRQRLPAQAVVDQMPGYSPTLVDHAGRALSERPGHVRLVLDPFSGYRNLGNQRATSFTIDENGFRGGFRGGADRALAFLLGASTAFGHGVPRDDDTLASVLSRRQGRYRVVNAGVIGYESGQELGLMTHYLDRFGPR